MKATEPSIESPCIRNCCLNEDDVCLGCFRTLDEIIHWQQADAGKRLQVLDEASKRQRLHHQTYPPLMTTRHVGKT